MRYIGYANMAHLNEHSSIVARELSEKKCSIIHLEPSSSDSKNEWNYFIDELKDGDTAVIYSFNNVFHSFNDMMYFLKLCSARKIRIISIHDEIDSANTSISGTLTAITKVANKKKEDTTDTFLAELFTGSKQDQKLKRKMAIINMYKAGYSIKDIMTKTGTTYKAFIYRVLRAYKVPLEYPMMARNQKGKNQVAAVV